MPKKQKRKTRIISKPREKDRYFYKDITVDDKQIDEWFKVLLHDHNVPKNTEDLSSDLKVHDLDQKRLRKREIVTRKYLKQASDIIRRYTPEVEGYYWPEKEWIELNAMFSRTYDWINQTNDLLFGATLHILESIYEQDRQAELFELLNDYDGKMYSEWLPQTVYPEEVVKKTLSIVVYRNNDCKGYRQNPKMFTKYMLDDLTVAGTHKQDVPSRRYFEDLLKLLETSDSPGSKLCVRMKGLEIFHAMLKGMRDNGLYQDMINDRKQCDAEIRKMYEYSDEMERLMDNDKPEPLPYNAVINNYTKIYPTQGLRQTMGNVERINSVVREIEKAQQRVDAHTRKYFLAKTGIYDNISGMLVYGKRGNRYWEFDSIVMSDPYRICFGLLMMMEDSDEDIWLYYPYTQVALTAFYHLPWIGVPIEDDGNDDLQEGYFNPWEHTLPIMYENSPLKGNLTHTVYMMNSIIPPSGTRYIVRNKGVLDEYSVDVYAKQILLMGESSNNLKEAYQKSYDDMTKNRKQEDADARAEEEDKLKKMIEQLSKELRESKEKYAKLKDDNYKQGKALEETKDALDDLQREYDKDKEELSGLRKILFHLDTTDEQYEEELEQEVAFPYSTDKHVVIFGGHPQWQNRIKALLPDARVIDPDTKVNTDLIKNADLVALQTSYMSHSDYYTIIPAVKNNDVELLLLGFGKSAKICAKEIVNYLQGSR